MSNVILLDIRLSLHLHFRTLWVVSLVQSKPAHVMRTRITSHSSVAYLRTDIRTKTRLLGCIMYGR